jgi:hypothetical protein
MTEAWVRRVREVGKVDMTLRTQPAAMAAVA